MASFDENGKYIKTNWKAGDKITATKLNKIEESIEAVNDNDISRHVEADVRLDALEAKDVAHDKEFTNVKNLIADNKAAAELGDYEINSRMQFLEQELNEGIEEVHNVASTVDGKIATAEANMASAVAQGKADMEAMVAEVEGELEGLIHNTNILKAGIVYAEDFGCIFDGRDITENMQTIINSVGENCTICLPKGEAILNDTLNIKDKNIKFVLDNNTRIVSTLIEDAFLFSTNSILSIENGVFNSINRCSVVYQENKIMPRMKNVEFNNFKSIYTVDSGGATDFDDVGYVTNCTHYKCGGTLNDEYRHCYQLYGLYSYMDDTKMCSVTIEKSIFKECTATFWCGWMKSVRVMDCRIESNVVTSDDTDKHIQNNSYLVSDVVYKSNFISGGFSGLTTGKHPNNVIISDNIIKNTLTNGISVDARLGHIADTGTQFNYKGEWDVSLSNIPDISSPLEGDYVIVSKGGYITNTSNQKYYLRRGDRVYYSDKPSNGFNWFVDYPSSNITIVNNFIDNCERVFVQASDVLIQNNRFVELTSGIRLNGGVRNIIKGNVFSNTTNHTGILCGMRGECNQFDNTYMTSEGSSTYAHVVASSSAYVNNNYAVEYVTGYNDGDRHNIGHMTDTIISFGNTGRVYVYLPMDLEGQETKIFKLLNLETNLVSLKTRSNYGTLNSVSQINCGRGMYYIFLNGDKNYQILKVNDLTILE